jgi:hypothetical protein
MIRAVAAAATVLLALAACDAGREPGTAVAITAGNGSAAMGTGGEVKIDTPAFQGAFKLPKVNLTADDFDIDGVHLYPGSRIAAVDVKGAGGPGDGEVTIRFDSPADAATVRGWLAAQFAKAGKEVAVEGNRLRGRTDDGRFTIALTPAGARTQGVVEID